MRISRLNLVCIICVGLLCLVVCACDNNPPPKAELPSLNLNARAAQNTTTPDKITAVQDAEVEDLEGFEVEEAKLYSGIDKINPFLPLIKSDGAVPDEEDGETKRVPQTPLERFDIGQLRLSAVVGAPDGNSAIIVESSGRGYVVRTGAYIGLNGGQITEIKNDRVIIEEPMGKNERGEVKVNVVELILPKPAGAF